MPERPSLEAQIDDDEAWLAANDDDDWDAPAAPPAPAAAPEPAPSGARGTGAPAPAPVQFRPSLAVLPPASPRPSSAMPALPPNDPRAASSPFPALPPTSHARSGFMQPLVAELEEEIRRLQAELAALR